MTVLLSGVADLERRLPDRLARWAPQLLSAQLCYGVDSYTLAAMMDRESRGGDALEPKGPTGVGDHGHGRGLCQLDDRFHAPFIFAVAWDGTPLWQDPAFNILYAAKLLAFSLHAFGGSYPPAIAAFNCGLHRAREHLMLLPEDASTAAVVAELDKATTGGDYVSDCLRRRDGFLKDTPKEQP